jgi:hypothetical protein
LKIQARDHAKRKNIERVGFEQYISFSLAALFRYIGATRESWLRSWAHIPPRAFIFISLLNNSETSLYQLSYY